MALAAASLAPASALHGRCSAYFGSTSYVSLLPLWNSLMLATVVLAMFCRASAVRKAECGLMRTLGYDFSSWNFLSQVL